MIRAPFQGAHLRKLCPPRIPSVPTLASPRLLSSLSQSAFSPSDIPEPITSPSSDETSTKVTRRISLSSLTGPSSNPTPIKPELRPPTAPSPAQAPAPSSAMAPSAHTESYSVARTPSNNLPVYEKLKNSTLKTTTVRKISGDSEHLRTQLLLALVPTPKSIVVNTLTKHVIVKGFYKAQVEQFLRGKGF